MNTLQQNYDLACATPSDINEHLPTIKGYVQKCSHVTEMGVRGVVSTWAMLAGLPKKCVCIDINVPPLSLAEEAARKENIELVFVQADTCDPAFNIERTDLLLIDTLHLYDQLKIELEKHHSNVNKYIILHDTTSYGEVGETTDYTYANTYVKVPATPKGLWPAITEFLDNHKDWKLLERFTNNNGLTILGK